MKKFITALVASACLCAGAEVVHFKFTGTVTYASTMVVVGEQVTGSFSYDTRLKPTVKYVHADVALYQIPASMPITGQVGNVTVSAINVQAHVEDNVKDGGAADLFAIGGTNPVVNGVQCGSSSVYDITLGSGNGKALKSFQLPEAFDLSLYDIFAIGRVICDDQFLFQFNVDTIEKMPN